MFSSGRLKDIVLELCFCFNYIIQICRLCIVCIMFYCYENTTHSLVWQLSLMELKVVAYELLARGCWEVRLTTVWVGVRSGSVFLSPTGRSRKWPVPAETAGSIH